MASLTSSSPSSFSSSSSPHQTEAMVALSLESLLMVPVPKKQQQTSGSAALEELDPESLLPVLMPQQQQQQPPADAAASAALVVAPTESPISPLTISELGVPAFLQVGLYSTIPQEMHHDHGDVPLYKPFCTFVGLGTFASLLLIGFAIARRRRRHDVAERSLMGITIGLALVSLLLRLLLAHHHHPTR